MTLLTNYQNMNIQVHDLRKTINTHNFTAEFHRCFSNAPRAHLYNTKKILYEYNMNEFNMNEYNMKDYNMNKTEFVIKQDEIKPLNIRPIYKLLDQVLYLMNLSTINDKSLIKMKFQRRKACPYISDNIPEIFFPEDYKRIGIFCVNNHNITNNIYNFNSSAQYKTDTLIDMLKFELSPGFLCILNNTEDISMIPSSILVQDPYLDDGYEDTIIISYHQNNTEKMPYID